MKSFQAILVAGGALALIGVSVLYAGIGSFPSEAVVENFTIPAGPAYFYYIQYQIDGGSHLSVSFSVASGSVDAYILDSGQYEIYRQDLSGGGLASSSGGSGSLSADLVVSGPYYVTFDHGAGYEGVPQDVHATVRFGGT